MSNSDIGTAKFNQATKRSHEKSIGVPSISHVHLSSDPQLLSSYLMPTNGQKTGRTGSYSYDAFSSREMAPGQKNNQNYQIAGDQQQMIQVYSGTNTNETNSPTAIKYTYNPSDDIDHKFKQSSSIDQNFAQQNCVYSGVNSYEMHQAKQDAMNSLQGTIPKTAAREYRADETNPMETPSQHTYPLGSLGRRKDSLENLEMSPSEVEFQEEEKTLIEIQGRNNANNPHFGSISQIIMEDSQEDVYTRYTGYTGCTYQTQDSKLDASQNMGAQKPNHIQIQEDSDTGNRTSSNSCMAEKRKIQQDDLLKQSYSALQNQNKNFQDIRSARVAEKGMMSSYGKEQPIINTDKQNNYVYNCNFIADNCRDSLDTFTHGTRFNQEAVDIKSRSEMRSCDLSSPRNSRRDFETTEQSSEEATYDLKVNQGHYKELKHLQSQSYQDQTHTESATKSQKYVPQIIRSNNNNVLVIANSQSQTITGVSNTFRDDSKEKNEDPKFQEVNYFENENKRQNQRKDNEYLMPLQIPRLSKITDEDLKNPQILTTSSRPSQLTQRSLEERNRELERKLNQLENQLKEKQLSDASQQSYTGLKPQQWRSNFASKYEENKVEAQSRERSLSKELEFKDLKQTNKELEFIDLKQHSQNQPNVGASLTTQNVASSGNSLLIDGLNTQSLNKNFNGMTTLSSVQVLDQQQSKGPPINVVDQKFTFRQNSSEKLQAQNNRPATTSPRRTIQNLAKADEIKNFIDSIKHGTAQKSPNSVKSNERSLSPAHPIQLDKLRKLEELEKKTKDVLQKSRELTRSRSRDKMAHSNLIATRPISQIPSKYILRTSSPTSLVSPQVFDGNQASNIRPSGPFNAYNSSSTNGDPIPELNQAKQAFDDIRQHNNALKDQVQKMSAHMKIMDEDKRKNQELQDLKLRDVESKVRLMQIQGQRDRVNIENE